MPCLHTIKSGVDPCGPGVSTLKRDANRDARPDRSRMTVVSVSACASLSVAGFMLVGW